VCDMCMDVWMYIWMYGCRECIMRVTRDTWLSRYKRYTGLHNVHSGPGYAGMVQGLPMLAENANRKIFN
jgi:hypothetical protein